MKLFSSRSARSLRAGFTRRVETGSTFALITTALYVIVLIVGHFHHEMWRDEMHCWMVGRGAAGLSDLLNGDRRYDGHPFLWYYILHLASRVWSSYKIMHVVVVASAGVAAFAWLRAPGFPRYLKVLLLGSYYLIYEYTILNRSYVLGVLLVFLFCAFYHPLRIRYVLLASLLALLAATSAYGTIMATSLAMVLFLQPLVTSFEFRRSAPRVLRVSVPPRWLLAFAIFMFGLCCTVATTIPPKDEWFATATITNFTADTVRTTFERYWLGMVPFPDWRPLEFWNTSAVMAFATPEVRRMLVWASALLLVAWLVALRKRPVIMLAYLAGVSAMALLQAVKYAGDTRHHGHFFILLIGCVWLAAREQRAKPLSLGLTGLFLLNVGAQVGGGAIAYAKDFAYPFGGALATAEFIRSQGLERLPVVATWDGATSAVAGYLDSKPFLYPETNEVAAYVVWNNRRKTIKVPELLQRAKEYGGTTGADPLIVTTDDIGTETVPGMTTELLYYTGVKTIVDERFYVYRTTITDRPAARK